MLVPTLFVAFVAFQPAPVLRSLKVVQGVRPIALAAAPTGTRFAACLENNTVRVYDAVNLTVVRVLIGHPQPAYAVAWHPKGTMIASGDESGRIFIWDIKTGKQHKAMNRTHLRGVQNLCFDATGTKLLSTGKDDWIRIFEVKSGRELRKIPGKGANFYSAVYLPGGSFAVATLGDGVRVYGPSGVAKKFQGHTDGAVWDFDFNPASNRLVSGGRDSFSMAYDLKLAQRLQTFRGHGDWVNHVRITPNGRFAFTASTDRTVRIWNLKTLTPAGVMENMASVGSPLCITANGQYLIGVNLDDWMQLFEISPLQGKAAK